MQRGHGRSASAKTLVFTLALAAATAAPAPAQAPVASATSSVVEIEVPAPSLEGNRLGTPTVQQAAVYLPAGYDLDADRRYPVVYLLHGIFDTYQVWLEHFGLPSILDRLIESGRLPPLILVMPNGGNPFGGGFYRDSEVSGNWAGYVVSDLVDHIDGSFRTLARAGGRALIGHSMGGYGALHLSMSRPGTFSVAWAMSPCCLWDAADFGFGNDAWRRAYRFESPADLEAALASNDFYAVAALGVLAAFRPDPDRPPFFVDFPFELVRGEVVLIDDEYDGYLDELPVRRVAGARDALRGLRGLALDSGLGDQFLHIPVGTLELSRRLGELRVPHLLDLYDGDHRQLLSERLEEVVLPWVVDRLDVE